MTDFNSINPEPSKANLNANRQNKNAQTPDAANDNTTAPATDPYANLKMDPDQMFKLLDAQAKMNIPAGIDGSSAMTSFSGAVSPERHARVSRLMEQAYTQEFGNTPGPGILQDLVDDYLIGRPSVQNA
jgi:hypothetical protein